MASITIECKLPGRSRPVFGDWHLSLPPEVDAGGGRTTLRALITRIVIEEVAAFRARQREQRFTRFLSAAQIADGVECGKVDMQGRTIRQQVREDDSIAAALQAFEDGHYLVFIDEVQALSLDEEVYIRPDTEVVFVRLVALAGL